MNEENRKAIDYALRLLKIRDRSSGEIERKMLQKGFFQEEIKAVLDWLIEKELINDQKFAKKLINYQQTIKPQGRRRLWVKLKQLNVEDDIIEEALHDVSRDDELGMARETAARWVRKKGNIPYEEIYSKLAGHLSARGFSWEIAREVLEEYRGMKPQSGHEIEEGS